MNAIRDDRFRTDLAELAEMVAPVDLYQRVLNSSRRAARRRVGSALGAFTIVAGVIGANTWAVPPGEPEARVGGPVPTTLPTDNRLADLFGPPPNAPGGLVPATLDLPAWPGASGCPHGPVTFGPDGSATLPSSAHYRISVRKAIQTDVNTDGRPDYVAIVECHDPMMTITEQYSDQVLVFTDLISATRTLGRVVASGSDGIGGVYDLNVTSDGTVRVRLGDTGVHRALAAQQQWRSYAWRDAAFVQTAGPRGFDPGSATVDLSAVGTIARPRPEELTLTVRVINTGATAARGTYLYLGIPVWLSPTGDGWTGCRQRGPTPAEPALVVIRCPGQAVGVGGAFEVAYNLLVTGSLGPGRSGVAIIVDQADEGRVVERDPDNNYTEVGAP
ncbi:MAG TPA: hypothetical protein VF163_07665 [Micromonosporaceae bacterium]